ncbi:MAG: nitrogenase molybdenum-iron protein alpha chain [Elusimicrobia bacterium RIFOXYA2_FULL_50_26]|nr:MAG: nitrogenase molybdenum-iron protein alpha chain [Elusimicrobia bacterium RIFOXYA2_FULL_50_26]
MKRNDGTWQVNPSSIKENLIKRYSAKVGKKRAKQIVINNPKSSPGQEIGANVRTVPGIITQRGCTYAGCKGVVLGPTRDILNLTHGPIGCGFYSWLTRRNQTRPEKDTDPNFMPYCLSTDMQDENIIFGGEKKLRQAVEEAYAIFKPRAIGIFATCPVGLIGDDIHSVARDMSEKLGINVFGFSCEGYKGVSQSAGHHIANNQLFKHVIGKNPAVPDGKYKVALLGEYNIGGDAFVLEDMFRRCGIGIVATFSGNSTYDGFAGAHHADLNLAMCHRSINYVADMIEKKYGVPWIKVNFTGADATAKSLRKVAGYFESAELMSRVEKVIEEEMEKIRPVQEDVKLRTAGKTAMLFVGGSRAHHYQELFREMGMKIVAAGYEFAHRDDYEGRGVLPAIKVDADSRNIEELDVKPHPEQYRPRKTPEDMERLARAGISFKSYEGMMPEMDEGTLVIDDINHFETEILIEKYKPDIFCAGIKEKYVIQKMGIPMKQLHSYDYGGPYAGFAGAINFYRDVDRMIGSKVWKLVVPPWEKDEPIAAMFINPV